jgi:hypothetical protein
MTLKGSHTNSPEYVIARHEANTGKRTVGKNHYGVVAKNKNKGTKHTLYLVLKNFFFKKKNNFRKIPNFAAVN